MPHPALHDVSLAPTGIDVLTPDTGAYGRTVVDGEGMIWAPGDGRLVRFDPTSGSARTWTVSDDTAFGINTIAPARDGGVWLIDGRMLRLFDGTLFRTVVEAPAEAVAATAAPDGSLWVATIDGKVTHWTGSSWTSLDPGQPIADAAISMIAVDAAGRPWIGWTGYPVPPGTGSVSRYDGSGWTTFDGQDASPLGSPVWDIVQFPDGAVWVASDGGIARFDGSSWAVVAATPGADAAATSVAAAPDGAAWAGGGGAILAKWFDGQSWSYGPSEGVSSDLYRAAWVMPVKDELYVGTSDGIYRLADDRWERAWPPAISPRNVWTLLAVSRDELWAGRHNGSYQPGDSGQWHWQGGQWTNEPIDPARPAAWTAAMAIAPDGTVWAAGDAGVAYYRDGVWTIVDPTPASAIAFDQGRGRVGHGQGCLGRVGAGARRHGVGATGNCLAATAEQPVDAIARGRRARGAVAGRFGDWGFGGLARFDGSRWETLDELEGSPIGGATVLGTDPGGAVWIEVTRAVDASQTEPAPVLTVRVDGEEQTVVEMPAGNPDTGAQLAPDGTLWVATDHGPARYDGQRWTYPYERISPSWMGVDRVATDGTVYGSIGSLIVRLPAPAH